MKKGLEAGTIKRIHMNRHVIRAGGANPLRIKTSKENIEAGSVFINGPSVVMYRPEKPLSCGAKAWVETRSAVLWEVV